MVQLVLKRFLKLHMMLWCVKGCGISFVNKAYSFGVLFNVLFNLNFMSLNIGICMCVCTCTKRG